MRHTAVLQLRGNFSKVKFNNFRSFNSTDVQCSPNFSSSNFTTILQRMLTMFIMKSSIRYTLAKRVPLKSFIFYFGHYGGTLLR